MPRQSAPLVLLALSGFLLLGCSKKEAAPPVAAVEPAPAAEPAPAPALEHTKAFKIGALDAIALKDGGMDVPNDNKVFGVGQKPEDVAAVLSANNLPTDKLALSIQPLLVRSADKVLLFDTGASGNFGPTAGQLPMALTEAGIDILRISDIFISHVHGDHIGGLVNGRGELAFPNARIHISAPEWKFLSGLEPEMAKNMGLNDVPKLVATLQPKIDAFKPGAELIAGVVKAVDIKGHTPGHSGYLIGSGTETLLYVGDTLHHQVISVQKPEWTMGYDNDPKVAPKSRAALIAKAAADGQRVYAVHFPFPGLGKFEKRGDTFAWVAE